MHTEGDLTQRELPSMVSMYEKITSLILVKAAKVIYIAEIK